VLDALRQARGPLSAYALLDLVRGEGFSAPTQVYRALDRLRQHGLVHRLETLNAYVSCSHPRGDGVTAFAICDNCGHIDELVDRTLGNSLQRLANRCAFSPKSSTIEIHGRCAVCTGLAQATPA
jgi:Fur family zinc uptake transcriptional regulator